MTKLYFEELMAELGCQVQDGMAFCAKNGLPYSLELTKTGEPAEILARFALNGPAKACLKALKEKPEKHLRWHAEGNTLVCVLALPSEFYAKSALHSMLAGAASATGAAGLAPPAECPLCGNAGCDVYAYLEGDYRPAHQACLDTRLALPEGDTVLKRPVKGFYGTGALGAVLGALVGAVPAWSQLLAGKVPHPVFYAFIPIFSALFYRLLRGKTRYNFAAIAVLLGSLLGAVALEQVGYWMLLHGQGYPVSLFESIGIYFSTHQFLPSLRQMLFSLLLLIVGLFPAAHLLRGYTGMRGPAEEKVRGAAFVRATAMPIRPPAGEDAPEQAAAALPAPENAPPPPQGEAPGAHTPQTL